MPERCRCIQIICAYNPIVGHSKLLRAGINDQPRSAESIVNRGKKIAIESQPVSRPNDESSKGRMSKTNGGGGHSGKQDDGGPS